MSPEHPIRIVKVIYILVSSKITSNMWKRSSEKVTAYIRPILEYALLVWSPHLGRNRSTREGPTEGNKGDVLSKGNKVQGQAKEKKIFAGREGRGI